MPMPPVEPMPLPATEFLRPPPLEAQDASYFAASARIRSFCTRVIVLNIHTVVFPVNDAGNLAGRPRRQTRRRYSVLKNRLALNTDFRPQPLVSLDGIQPEWPWLGNLCITSWRFRCGWSGSRISTRCYRAKVRLASFLYTAADDV